MAVTQNDNTLPAARPAMTANDIFDPSSARLPSGTSAGPYIMHVLPTCPLLNANAEMSNAGAASDDAKSQCHPVRSFAVTHRETL